MIKWVFVAAAAGAGVFGAYLLWRHLSCRPPALPLYDEVLIESAAHKLQHSLSKKIPSGRLLMLPVRGDGTGRITHLIRDALTRSGRFDVVVLKEEKGDDPSIGGLLRAALKRLLEPRETKALLESRNADALLSLTTRKTDTPDRLIYSFTAFVDTKKGRVATVSVQEAMDKSVFDLRFLSCAIRSHPVILRLFYFIVFVGLLPWTLYKVCERVLALERNLYNGLLLCGLTAAGLLWTFFLLGLGFHSFFATVAFLLALPVVLFYNWWALDVMERMRR